jgi:two-component system sensor kinase FixL
MREANRETYCDDIGAVPWGTHICLFYHTKKDLIDILVPYFKAGLEQNEFCMWVTSEPLLAEEAQQAFQQNVNNFKRYLERGQIEFVDDNQWYTPSGVFDADAVLQGWVEKEQGALKRGFDGLRLTGNTFWPEKTDWRAFTEYEATIARVIGAHRMIAICTYSLEQCGASEVLDLASNYEYTLIRREGQWETFESANRKRAEEVLKASQIRYQRLFETIKDGILLLDADTGKIIDVNPFLLKMLNYSRQEFLAKHLWEIGPFKQIAAGMEAFTELQRKRSVRYEDWPLETKDGKWITVEFVSNVYWVNDQKVIQCNIRDITERKQSEKELKQAYKELAAIQQELIQSETLAALGGFASGVAHEIRNPLTNIQVSAQYCLRNNSLGKETEEFLRIILRNAEKANRTIAELLDFAKPNQLSFKLADIVQVIRRTCDLTKARRAHQKVRLYKRCARRLPGIVMDAHRIEQVLLNCIMNALDAMKNGGILSITAFPEGEDVVITISDTGIGIRKQDLDKLFTPFFTTKPAGAGLGLSLARRLIQLHNGSISITSKVHEGTQVTIRFPMLAEKHCKEPGNGNNPDR